MNKSAFMDKMFYDLAPLPENERNELLARCEECFRIGLEQGKTEEEIVAELGYPSQPPSEPPFEPLRPEAPYGQASYSDRVPPPEAWGFPPPGRPDRAGRDVPRFIGVGALLLFLNLLVMIPVFASLFAAFVSVCVASLATLLAPLALVAETSLYGEFTNAKLMMSLGMTGIGMILADLALLFGRGLFRAAKAYAGWNYRTLKGR
ncbi:DUF1700 domain-containing protein [Cohnella cellulosilytica]|uniref:DUF1700 domain-containing protein n=1 Tax=Cohnella cellulosilytica TaxID=986710 RepID=A0ABW2FCN2_9BACL